MRPPRRPRWPRSWRAARGTRNRASFPRASDGRPDLSGIWQAVSSAHWNIEPHAAYAGRTDVTGAIGAAPGGLGIVGGNGLIPYRPEAIAKRQENFENRRTEDPEAKCYLPGVPRATYMPFPFQIVQGTDKVFIAYEFASANRVIHMTPVPESPVDTWMGHSVGPLGRRFARRGRHRVQRPDLVRPGR